MELAWAYGIQILWQSSVMFKSLILFFYFFTFFGATSEAVVKPYSLKNKKAVYNEYMRLHRKFTKYVCSKKEDQTYKKLLKSYRGEGYYIPVLNSKTLDKGSIKKNIPLLIKKKKWIESQIRLLKKKKSFKKAQSQIKIMEKTISSLLKFKQVYAETDFKSVRKRTLKSSRKKMDFLKKTWHRLIEEIPFLIGFNYPVSHFEMRQEYDLFRELKGIKNKKKSNEIYFRRKIFEDGAQNKNRTRGDKFSRALINMMYFHLRNEKSILSENVRYDLKSIISTLKIYLNWSHKHHIQRMSEWLTRTNKNLGFYQKILKQSLKKSAKSLKRKSNSTYAIKSYIGKQQAKSYKFWTQYPELYRALFSMETILINEVGDIDGPDALERKDVAQVVINRSRIPYFSSLDNSDYIMPYFSKKTKKTIYSYPWLNLLFKTGEFSFTYYYISATSHIFCPDKSPRAKKLRKNNIWLSMDLLKKPNNKFKALRYFSRASMLGRIDMTPVWDDYQALAERPGNLVRKQSSLRSAYRRGKYTFLYGFKGPKNKFFEVIEIKKSTYVFDPSSKVKTFYKYRNPHYFKYFSAKAY